MERKKNQIILVTSKESIINFHEWTIDSPPTRIKHSNSIHSLTLYQDNNSSFPIHTNPTFADE